MDQIKLYSKVLNKKKEIELANEVVDVLHKELKELFKECKHTSTEPKSSYYGGSYDNLARTNYWDECIICGKDLNSKTETHSYYG